MTAQSLLEPTANNSPALAQDPTEPRFLAAASRTDNPDFSCALHVSPDRGRSWAPARPFSRLPKGADKCYAPEVAFNRDGRLFFLFVGLQGRGNSPMGVYLVNSEDRGRTFSQPKRVLGSDVYMVRMAVDQGRERPGRMYLTWVQANGEPTSGFPQGDNPVLAAASMDAGMTWSRPARVSDRNRSRVIAPAIAVGEDGRVHVVYWDLKDDARDYLGLEGPVWEGTWSLAAARSFDAGRSFKPGKEVDDAVVPPERIMVIFTAPSPALTADDEGNVYVAWTDARNGNWDVLMRRSADGGRRWARPQSLNDDSRNFRSHQYLPKLAVSPDGRLDAIFYDRRHDPENVHNRVSYTFSTDGGRVFSKNVTLSSESSDPRVGPTFPVLPSARGLVEFGGRLGLASTAAGPVAAWTDTRNTEPGFIQQDVFAASLRLHSSPREPRSARGSR